MTTQMINAGPGAQAPKDAKRVYRWADLPPRTDAATFVVDPDGADPRRITVSKRMRQVLEGLMRHPIYAASYCRIGDRVLPLRRDHGLEIVCTMYENDPETGRERYGVYELKTKVRRAVQKVAA
ncbi:MAG: hypothetical protein AAGA38_03015 [Pseudomonadota bacterium]